MARLILASKSQIRAKILHSAGVPFEIAAPNVDEGAIKRANAGLALADLALRLADAKALSIKAGFSDFVLGSDQILSFEGDCFDKPRDMAEASARLRLMQGKRHRLINAVSIARGGVIAFRHADEAILFMRSMSESEIDAYLKAAGECVLASVGAYQIEDLGARLFERVDGDYFTVLGLSLFPALGYLRREGFLRF